MREEEKSAEFEHLSYDTTNTRSEYFIRNLLLETYADGLEESDLSII